MSPGATPRAGVPVMVDPPLGLGDGHRPAQVAGRAGVAGGPDDRQEPFGRDSTGSALDPGGDDGADRVVVVDDGRFTTAPERVTRLAASTTRLMVLSVVPQISAAAR